MAERDGPPGELALRPEARTADTRQLSSDENGHAESPDETLSPTSVIYFKEAYSSANVRFGDAGALLSAGPLPQFDFRIERIDSKRRSECGSTSSHFVADNSQQLCPGCC